MRQFGVDPDGVCVISKFCLAPDNVLYIKLTSATSQRSFAVQQDAEKGMMAVPSVRKLASEEIARLRQRGVRVDLSPYMQALSELSIGEWGVIELESGDKVPTIKRRYTVAAKSQGKALVYKRLRQGTIPFEVRDPSTIKPKPAPKPRKAAKAPTRSGPAAGRRGR